MVVKGRDKRRESGRSPKDEQKAERRKSMAVKQGMVICWNLDSDTEGNKRFNPALKNIPR
jgi:hypothetical protein